jgi:hypothetical protein
MERECTQSCQLLDALLKFAAKNVTFELIQAMRCDNFSSDVSFSP